MLACTEQRLQKLPPTETRRMPAPTAVGSEQPQPSLSPSLSTEPLSRGDVFRRGIVLGPLTGVESGSAFKRAHTRLLDQAEAIGATDVQLVVRWSQLSPQSVELAPLDTVGDELLFWLIDQASRRKLRVLLTPTIGIESDPEADVGLALKPASWERWWWSYSRLVLHYARVAVMRKVPTLGVGAGLTSTETHAAEWRKLIADVRKIFKGELTYAATAESFERVDFWGDVDLVGIVVDARAGQPEAQLAPLAGRIATSEVGRTRGYLIMEVPARDAGQSLRQHRALFESFGDAARLRGIFVHDELSAGSKPARAATEALRDWFAKGRT